jgi:signal transduction histidine kinase
MTLRHTSIRTRMFLLVSVPLLALIGIYAYAVVGQFGTAVGLANAGRVSGTTITPLSDTMVALNAERTGAVLYLATRSSQAGAAFRHAQAATDRQFRAIETITGSGPVTSNATPLEKAAARAFLKDDRGRIHALRSTVASGGIGRTAAINAYSAIMSDGIRVAEQAIQQTYVSQPLATTARQEVNLYTAEMLVLQESDIYAADAGHMPAADQKEFAQLAAVRRYLVADAVPQLDPEASGLLRREVPASLTAALTSQENAIISAPASPVRPPVPLTTWQTTATTYASHLEVMLTKGPAWIQSQVSSSARGALTTLIVAASVGLLAVIASIVFSFLMGRRLLRRLNGLRRSALELARERLPKVMARLRDGEAVDVDAEAPPAEATAGADEIDQVHQAFDTVHRTAVEAAVDEAKLRRGVNDVFRNLARRNQALLHRQLGLLDGMERRAEEPEQLEDLFRIDHLTTRMRRHAEGLIVLSGDSSGRGWRQPVPFVDVLRAAVAEVEDYTRIRVEVRSKAALAGPAVADVVHLLAELMENGAFFSPSNTVVRVQGDLVGRGFAIEIEDRGLGIADEQLEEINRELASPPDFDPAGSDRLGLFISGRLAQRHGIKVTLRSSVFGGTSAIVIIPTGLVVTDVSRVPVAAPAAPALQPAAAALRSAGAAAALGTGNGHAGNGHAGNGHAGNGHGGNGHAGEVLEPRTPRHAAAIVQQDTQPFVFEPDAPSAGSGWWGRATLASQQAADSVPAAQAVAGATELVPDTGDHPAPEDQPGNGLPVRVPQAGLAPQLRDRNAADSGALQAPPLSAEAARSTMSAMQSGWERARSAAAGSPDEAAQEEE